MNALASYFINKYLHQLTRINFVGRIILGLIEECDRQSYLPRYQGGGILVKTLLVIINAFIGGSLGVLFSIVTLALYSLRTLSIPGILVAASGVIVAVFL